MTGKKKLTYTKGKFWVKYTYKKDIAILNKILVYTIHIERIINYPNA